FPHRGDPLPHRRPPQLLQLRVGGPGRGTWAALGAAATVERRDPCAHPVVSALHRCFDSRAGSPSTAEHDHLGLAFVRISPERGPQARTLIARAFGDDPLMNWLFPPALRAPCDPGAADTDIGRFGPRLVVVKSRSVTLRARGRCGRIALVAG